MSQSAYQSTIEDLPNVTSFTNCTITKEIFCLGLFINIAASGPCRLFVTDFTVNPRVSNSYVDSYFIDEFEIPTEQIFQIDVYKEKLKLLIDEYETRFGEPLFDSGPPFRISNKICILKASVVLKKFNNILEGRAKSIRLVSDEDMTSENLQKLYTNLGKLPKDFFIDNMTRAKTVIPNEFYKKIMSFSKDINPTTVEIPVNSDGSTNANFNANSNTDSIINDSQPRQTYVKTEETTESMIPDTLFPADYLNTGERLSDTDTLQGETEMESQNHVRNRSQENSRISLYQNYYSIKQLNDYHNHDIDNEVYRVKGIILGYNPGDWSHVCIKKYEHNSAKNKTLLSDPYMRNLELILCDQSPPNNQEGVLLNSDNSITVVLDQKQITQALNIEAIESAYTKLSELNKKSFTNEVLEFELSKKLVNINTKNQFLVWSARNISFDVIMK